MTAACFDRMRINYGGNYCGHDPRSPRLDIAIPAKRGAGGIPPILNTLADRINTYFYSPSSTLPTLNMANDKPSKQRSCRREACLLLLKALLKYCDLVTLKVGKMTEDGFKNMPIRFFAFHAGLSISRAERAFKDLVAAGIITSTPLCEIKDGHYRGLPSKKTIKADLFAAFGLKLKLKMERDKASKRRKNKIKPIVDTTRDEARHRLFNTSLMQKIKSKRKAAVKPIIESLAKPPPDLDRSRRLQLKALELKEQHPEWDRDQCFVEAEKLI